jgi:uncharacterized protein (DUF58 family)
VANIRLHHLERLLRHPACPLCCAAAIAALAFVLVSARALPLLGGILATLAIGGVGPWIAVRSATALIAWDRRRCRVADTLTATITWRSILPWWRPHVSLSWRDAEPGPRSLGSPAAVSTAATIDSARSVAVVPRRLGRFPRVAPAIESNQPFGVVTASRTLPMAVAVIVWPARAELRVPAGLVAVAGVGQEMSERITGYCGDSIGARDYRDGDSMRSIHWAHTARRDTLVVRERPGTAAAVVRLVVDHRLERIHREAGIHDRTLDAIVTVAFAIIESWLPRGVVFEIIWPGRAPVTPRTGSEITALLDELACLEPLSATNALLAISTQHRPRPVDLEIFLTTPSGRESLPAAVGAALCARHERLWIVVGGEPARTGAPPGRGRGERVVPVPLEPDPIAAVDAAFAALNHDTDTSPRNRASSKRRSYAPT